MIMILYDVKLVCPKTQKIIFSSLEKKPALPPRHLYNQEPKPLLMIETVDSSKEVNLEKYQILSLGQIKKSA